MIKRMLPALLLAVGLGALAGCSSPTVITLNDGREIQAVDTPSYDEDSGFYEFEQLRRQARPREQGPGPHRQGTLIPSRNRFS